MNVPVLGACLLVGLPQIPVPLAFTQTTPFQATIPLSIPNNPALKGVSLYVQSVHIQGVPTQPLASSDGIEFTIF